MLDLVRLSPLRLFPPGGKELYRQIALLTELSPGTEVLAVPSGKGVSLEYFVREHGVHATGVEPDPRLMAESEAHAKEEELGGSLTFQSGSPGDLPFRDETFDVVLGEVGLTANVDPSTAILELVRVARPGGRVVIIQLVWKAPVDDDRKAVLSHHLGARPLMAVELRRILKSAGVSDLHTEDWTDDETAFRGHGKKPFPDFAELFSLSQKLGVLRRAWRRWGWRGVRALFQREAEVHRLLTRERILGLNLLVGVKAGETTAENPSHSEEEGEEADEDQGQTSDLPLFNAEAEEE